MAAGHQPFGIEVRLASQLGDPFGGHISMSLLLIGVLQEFLGDRLGVNSGGHVVMTLVAQHADDFRGQNFIKYLNHCLPVCGVAASDGTLLHVLPGTPAEFLYICDELAFFLNSLRLHCFCSLPEAAVPYAI